MVLAALALLRDAGDPMPACAATLSGWFDLEARGTAAQGPDEPFLTTDWLRARGRDYVGAAGDLRSPLASPIEADLTGFPPLLLQAGGADLVRDDSRQLAEKATRAGVDTTLQIVPEMIHGWHGLPVPEADEALAAVGAFFASHLD
jgi:acetyl esterase/lipase